MIWDAVERTPGIGKLCSILSSVVNFFITILSTSSLGLKFSHMKNREWVRWYLNPFLLLTLYNYTAELQEK